MKLRAAGAITGTAAAIALVLEFKSSPFPVVPRRVIGAGPTITAPVAVAAPPPEVVRTTTTPGRTTTTTAAATRRTTSPTTVRTTVTSHPPTTAPAPRQYVGDDEPNQYGDVQVEITVQGRQLADVAALRLPSDRSRSRQISDDAAPQLRQEALDCQCWNIDTVSGATYTSDGYRQSLQSAFTKANL